MCEMVGALSEYASYRDLDVTVGLAKEFARYVQLPVEEIARHTTEPLRGMLLADRGGIVSGAIVGQDGKAKRVE